MGTTPKGYPYPEPSAANNVAQHLKDIVDVLDGVPGISTFTTAQRDALSGAQKWNGRVIYNSTLDEIQVYSAVLASWANTRIPMRETFTASGTWTKPPRAAFVRVEVWSAGGGGSTYGGGGGGYLVKEYAATDLNATEPVVVGAGGAGGINGSTLAGTGGASSFKDISVTGGGAGGDANSGTSGAGGGQQGGVADNGTPGAAGPNDSIFGGGAGGRGTAGGSSIYGGGGGGDLADGVPAGGASVFGGAGGRSEVAGGTPGSAPGGGGGSATGATAGGNGARGEVRVTTYF